MAMATAREARRCGVVWSGVLRRGFKVERSKMFEVVNPATGKVMGELPEEGKEEVAAKFEALAAGQKRWRTVPVAERRAMLERFNELLRLNMPALAKTLTMEMGKPIAQAKNEVRATVDRVRFYLENYEKVLKENCVLETSILKEKVIYEPLGVVANISAWNYPYFVSTNVFAAALLTGNAVLYKPSEHATLTGFEITRLLYEAGVPNNVFAMTTGRGETGSAVASQRGLGGLFFTGSYKTGLEVAKQTAPNLVKLQLELGGKDPVYVRADVPNIAAAAASIADGAFYNCGQSCCSVERVYVDKRIYNEFMDAFVKNIMSFKVGDPLKSETYIGPVARQPHLPYLAAQVSD
jgi:acyl-CoA reductase-like NAD-dependent aldehyde dehydrogenase